LDAIRDTHALKGRRHGSQAARVFVDGEDGGSGQRKSCGLAAGCGAQVQDALAGFCPEQLGCA
jgi:hypothetical protein